MPASSQARPESPSPGGYHFGTRREVAPADTLRRIRPLLPRAGITRLADVTGLDWIGIPVYQAIRPNSRNLSVAQGKGLTRTQAKVSALMESLESFHAERIDYQSWLRASVSELRRQLGYDPRALSVVREPAVLDPEYDPFAPPIGTPTALRDDEPIDWVAATDLSTGASTWVPRQLCELDFSVEERLCRPLFRASSNGLASGNSRAEALVHGLCEVVERDSLWHHPEARLDAQRNVDLATVDSRLAQQILRRFSRAGMQAQVVDISGPVELPCFEVYLSHPESTAIYHGSGCHPSRGTALLRALTEAAQSRLSHIAGSRDDFVRRTYAASALSSPASRASGAPRRAFQRAPGLSPRPMDATVGEIVRRIQAVTGVAPMAVDLTRPDFGIPVVFVVAPGLRLQPPTRQ
jgi:YcaO-like protein with predicted kinase domain